MKLSRSRSDFINDIKYLRSMTKLLGKLEVPGMYHTYQDQESIYDNFNHYMGTKTVYKRSYGFGLKQTKDFVEALFDYTE